MKRLLLFLLLASMAHGATWFATTSSANIDAVTWRGTQGASCAGSGTTLTWGSRAAGDVFNSNGCTSIALNVDPGVGGSNVTITTDATNTGGGFTYATASNLSLHMDVLCATTTTLVITGSTGGGTITGNITGPSATATANGVTDSHTLVTITVNGNLTGGAGGASTSTGYTFSGTTGFLVVNGNVTGGSSTGGAAYGLINNQSSTGTTTLNGNCIGGTTDFRNSGCAGQGTTGLIVVGNIISSARASGAQGNIRYTPAATNYILLAKDGSYVTGVIDTHATEMPTNPGVTNVRTGTAYGSFTGTLANSAAAGSGNW